MGNVGSDGRPFRLDEQERLRQALLSLQDELFSRPWQPFTPELLLSWHAELSAGVSRMESVRSHIRDIIFGSYLGVTPERIARAVKLACLKLE